jgi:hypothetical protein
MGWPAMRRYAEAIGPDGRVGLLRILEAPDEEMATVIGRLHLRDEARSSRSC